MLVQTLDVMYFLVILNFAKRIVPEIHAYMLMEYATTMIIVLILVIHPSISVKPSLLNVFQLLQLVEL